MKYPFAIAASTALFLMVSSAPADTGSDVGVGVLAVGWLASSAGGLATGIGTGVAFAEDSRDMRGWGIGSAVTGATNLGYATLFAVSATTTPSCDGFLCFDFRPAFALMAGINGTIGVTNAVLAGLALNHGPRFKSHLALPVTVLPTVLRDEGRREVPALVVAGRF